MHVTRSLDLGENDKFYSPISKYEYLTPLQRKKLREKRKLDISSSEDVKESDKPLKVKKMKKIKTVQPKSKFKVHTKDSASKKLKKHNKPEVRCSAAQVLSQTNCVSTENKKFFKTRSPEHIKKMNFVVPLSYKKSRLDFTEDCSKVPCSPKTLVSLSDSNEKQLNKSEGQQEADNLNLCRTINPLVIKVEAYKDKNILSPVSNQDNCEENSSSISLNSIEYQNMQEGKCLNFVNCSKVIHKELLKYKLNCADCENRKPDKVLSPVKINSKDISSTAKLYPIFYKKLKEEKKSFDILCPGKKTFHTKDTSKGSEQMIIDAGQKEIGAKQCKICNMIYTIGHEEDEKLHSNFHDMYLINLKFPGWKKECVIGNYDDGRVIKVTEDDRNFKLKKIQDILIIANRDLGFSSADFPVRPNINFLLFVSNDKRVRGCLIAESITSASPVILDEANQLDKEDKGKTIWKLGSWYASSESVRAVCGINRIWVAREYRRRKVASRMIDCLRSNFIYGYVIGVKELAFTDPSPDGREFAASYTGTDNFLVYK